MHTEILDVERSRLLAALAALPELDRFYLAGGTALSLHLGLRRSYDFDFFTGEGFNSDVLFAVLQQKHPRTTPLRVEDDTCSLLIDGIQVSFFRYPYPLISEASLAGEPFPGLKLAGIDDISAMKFSAIGSRGSKKDFYDLYQIYHLVPGFDSARLLNDSHRKFGGDRDLAYMIMGLSYFDDAEDEVLPKVFIPADWNAVKAFFQKEQLRMFEMEMRRCRDA